MSDLGVVHSQDRVQVELGEADVPLDAIFGAACAFTDRCFVSLAAMPRDAEAAKSVRLTLRPKPSVAFDDAVLAVELENELAAQALRERSAVDGEEFTTALTAAAFGAPQAAADPLAGLAHFDDPLGIAESWDKQQARPAELAVEPGKGDQTG
jgi:hypothetical protein